MRKVVFVAPYLGANMLRCLLPLSRMEDVQLGVVSHQPEESFPSELRARLAGHYQVENSLDPAQLVAAGKAFEESWGGIDRWLGYLEQQQEALAAVRGALGIRGLQPHQAANFRDKNRMKSVLRSAGIPVARQALVRTAEDALRFVDEVGYPIIVKPTDGAGAKGTLRVRDIEDLWAALNLHLPSVERPIQAEEFVRGEERTLESATVNGEVVWRSSTRYLPGPLEVLENPWMQYCILLPREQATPPVRAFHPVKDGALRALGMDTGFSHLEWFLTSKGRPVVSEVGARPPGANIMRLMGAGHDVDMWEKWVDLMARDRWSMPPRAMAAGCAFLRGQGRGKVVRAVHGLDRVREQISGLVIEHRLPRPGQPRSGHYEGDGFVIVQHPETDRVVDALRILVTELRVELG